MTWVKHDGGADPLWDPDKPVVRKCRVKFRNGHITGTVLESRKWPWPYGGRFPKDCPTDIMEYEEIS